MDLLTLHEIVIARAAPNPRPEDTDELDDDLDMVFSVLVGSSENRTSGCTQPIGAAEFDSGFDALTAPIGE